jgi:AcrR family transcriptional regulator
MARKTSRAKPRRQPLSRDRVLLAALRLVDKAGVASLSMRGLAQTLGVEAMSLYKHVANKDEVLDGLIDLVVTEITVPPLGTEWRHAMRERAISARHVFLRHPWAAVLMESRLMQSPVRLHYGDSVLGLLRHGGFTVPMAYRAFLLIDSYLYGFIMQEVNWPFDEADIPQVAEAMTAQMSPADHPHLVEVTGHGMTMSVEGKFGGVYDAEFTAGLELILDSLARLRDTLGPQSSVSESATVSADVVPREN